MRTVAGNRRGKWGSKSLEIVSVWSVTSPRGWKKRRHTDMCTESQSHAGYCLQILVWFTPSFLPRVGEVRMLVPRDVVHVSTWSFDRDDAWVLRTVENHRSEKPNQAHDPRSHRSQFMSLAAMSNRRKSCVEPHGEAPLCLRKRCNKLKHVCRCR